MTLRPNSPASRDIAYLLHPYTNARKHEESGPLIITEGKGCRVTDDQGRSYIEGMAGLWCASLGYGEERLVEAAARQMRQLGFYHSFAHKSHPAVIDLSEKLIEMTPGRMGKVFYGNSGSEANDTAVKLVWFYNNARGRREKKKIISRLRGYHGVTIASASLTGLPANHTDFDLPIANILHTSCPHYWRYAEEGESEEDFATRCAADLERMILDEGPETVAAFIGEPVMGAGGVIVPPATYWQKIQAVLRKYDVLLIADEVICGFGRIGSMFGCETMEIEPDMVTMAKALSASYLPISATLMRDEIYQVIADNTARIGTLGHGQTYSGHPVAAAVALETLKIYEERDIVSHVRAVAPVLQQELAALADHPLVGEVRGIGLVGAVELVADKDGKTPFEPLGKVGGYVDQRTRAHGAILRNLGDTIALSPPLVIGAEELRELVQILRTSLDEALDWARGEGLTAA
jgi:4-aminobutyrate--pyruvate transaminase